MATLEGIYVPRMLGRFRIIRGFAPLQVLAQISRPVPMVLPKQPDGTVQGNQREVELSHAEAIKRYLESGSLRFIPEVILCARAEYETVYDRESREVGVRSLSMPGLSINPASSFKFMAAGLYDVDPDDMTLTELPADERILQLSTVPKSPVPHRIQIGNQLYDQDDSSIPVIRRLDGNHRLHFALSLTEQSTEPDKYLAPFCLVLLGSLGDANADYVESMLFHTLNSTAVPLHSEHALRLVLGQPESEREAPDVEFANSPELFVTREIKKKIDVIHPATRERMGKDYATALGGAAKALIQDGPPEGVYIEEARRLAEDFAGALNEVLPRMSDDHASFCKSDFFPELVARCWLATDSTKPHLDRVAHAAQALADMARWLGKNGLDALEPRTSLAQQVFSIYEVVQKRVPKKIFLARWYPKDEDGLEKRKADLRLDQLKRCLDDLQADGIPLELVDMGTTSGGTFPIHEKMYEAIKQNEIVLIDLSGVRPNACIEAGYALFNHDKGRLLFLFQPTEQTLNNPAYSSPPFDLNTFRYEFINQAAEIPNQLKPHLKAIWEEAVKRT